MIRVRDQIVADWYRVIPIFVVWGRKREEGRWLVEIGRVAQPLLDGFIVGTPSLVVMF